LACLLTNEPAENQTKYKKLASKLANLLKGLEILASKKNILDHINRKSPLMGNKTNDVFENISNNLKEVINYENVYEIGLDAQIVKNYKESNKTVVVSFTG
jgi:hypothetical protein